MSVILEGVGHRFGDRGWLFRHVTTTLEPGHTYALTGPSGAGKSTLLGLVAGWVVPREGTIRKGAGRVAWVFQNPTGTPRRSALDIVAYPLLAHKLSVSEARAQALENMRNLGIAHVAERPFRALSGGEAQRLMLARATSINPGLLLIDEPTAQLDRATATTVSESIGALATEQTIVVVATHDIVTRDSCTDVIDLSTWSG